MREFIVDFMLPVLVLTSAILFVIMMICWCGSADSNNRRSSQAKCFLDTKSPECWK
jgi:hypothetical protein